MRFKRVDRQGLIFILLASWTAVVFLLGGGARSDITSLIVLRPLAAAICVVAGFFAWRRGIRQFRFLFIFVTLCAVAIAIQLVPLPPAVWQKLPGRDIVVEADAAMGLTGRWRPIALSPAAAWNALWSMTIPFATLSLATLATREHRFAMLWVFLAIAGVSLSVGTLQLVGGSDSAFYLYRITTNGSMVGLFANRNHHALYLASTIAMLAVFASTARGSPEAIAFRRGVAVAAGIGTLAFLLVLGSRAGLVLGLLGVISVALLYEVPVSIHPAPRGRTGRRRTIAVIAFAGCSTIAALALGLQSTSLQRLLATNSSEIRLAYWGPTLKAIAEYFPIGSGFGSFVPIFQMHEPLALLEPSYANHAHNDVLEVLLTGGLAGAALLLVAVGAFVRGVRQPGLTGRDRLYQRLGAVILLMIGLASIVDYPLRVPSITVLAIFCAIWMIAVDRNKAHPLGTMEKV